MVPPYSVRISRVRTYSGFRSLRLRFDYRTLTFFGWASHPILLRFLLHYPVLTPNVLLPSVWPLSLSLATTHEISVDVFSSSYLDVSVRRVPYVILWIHITFIWHYPYGVSPFGYLRIKGYLRLPAAFRSLSRPSSAPDAKAFPLCSS